MIIRSRISFYNKCGKLYIELSGDFFQLKIYMHMNKFILMKNIDFDSFEIL